MRIFAISLCYNFYYSPIDKLYIFTSGFFCFSGLAECPHHQTTERAHQNAKGIWNGEGIAGKCCVEWSFLRALSYSRFVKYII